MMVSRNYIGAHIKRDDSGGIIETMNNIRNNGGNALQIFVSNPRSITITNIDSQKMISSLLYTPLIL